MLIWRLVSNNLFSLHELETTASLDDAMRATAVLDLQADMEEESYKKAKQ